MPKFRKKPVVVSAEQWFPGMPAEGASSLVCGKDACGARNTPDQSVCALCGSAFGGVTLLTLEGLMVVRAGDFIITGVKGEVYPCRPDVFALTYEPVSED
jgi:hypothetical protein